MEARGSSEKSAQKSKCPLALLFHVFRAKPLKLDIYLEKASAKEFNKLCDMRLQCIWHKLAAFGQPVIIC
jgi:hypothetical protein